jgi:hypothetical protein
MQPRPSQPNAPPLLEVTVEEIRSKTEAAFSVSPELKLAA